MPDEPWSRPAWVARTQVMLDSYRHWTGCDLVPRVGSAAQQSQSLYNAPFIVLAHGTEADPILNYGNQAALSLWETDLPTFLATPSRLTAEPVHRDERSRLLDRVSRGGYIDDYSGVRISLSGRRFLIERATVWNLLDSAGGNAGQAATFDAWRPLGGE